MNFGTFVLNDLIARINIKRQQCHMECCSAVVQANTVLCSAEFGEALFEGLNVRPQNELRLRYDIFNRVFQLRPHRTIL